MKKYLSVLIGICLCHGVFADEQSGGVFQNQHVRTLMIPRPILEEVLIHDDLLSQAPGAYERMMAKYDSLAGPFSQEPLTVNDVTQICVASGVITEKNECLNRVLNPAFTKMGRVRFFDVCSSNRITGGTNHCVDDVFIKGRAQNGNQYHQDVEVSPYTAFGFAIEYAKKNGQEVWCSSEINNNIVNCTTLNNTDFWSVKFKGTNNTADSTIEKNLIKGVCALHDAEYSIGTFLPECKMNCLSGTEANKIVQKFGLSVHSASTVADCIMHLPTYTAKDVKTYPGYEYMSYKFKDVQSVLDASLIKVLETYVKIQGINVQSFDCDYSTKKYSDEMPSGVFEGMPVSLDDMLRCQINGTDVDFIFDDLFEGREYERRAGEAAMQCVLAGGDFGSDKTCRNLTQAQCSKANAVVPGGTRWDNSAQVCLLNQAETARNISNFIQVGTGIALAIVFTPTGMPFVALAAVAGSVALDAAFIGLERLQILEPASRARQFAEDAQRCEIPVGSEYPSCSQKQVDCAWLAINQHFARLDEILDELNPDQLSLIFDLMENTTACLSDDLLHSAVNMSTLNAWDKAMNKASVYLLIAGIFIQPEKGVLKITENAEKMARILGRCKMVERTSDVFDGVRYLRVNVDNLHPAEIVDLQREFRNQGLFVTVEPLTTRNGERFIGVAERDIFKNFGLQTDRIRWSRAGENFLEQFKYGIYEGNPQNWQDVLIKWNLSTNTPGYTIERKYREMLAELDRVAADMDPGEAGYFFEKLTNDYNMLRDKPGFNWIEPDYNGWLYPTYNRYMYGRTTSTAVAPYFERNANGLFVDISDTAGRARLNAISEKYGISVAGIEDPDRLMVPGDIEDIVARELGGSKIEQDWVARVQEDFNDYLSLQVELGGDPTYVNFSEYWNMIGSGGIPH